MAVLMAAALFMFLSPTFNIKTITVEGNQKITSQEIISLSQISLDQNTFTIRLSQVEANIKEQPYIESVQVKRILPGEIAITSTIHTNPSNIAILFLLNSASPPTNFTHYNAFSCFFQFPILVLLHKNFPG